MRVGALVIWILGIDYIDVITPDPKEVYTVRSVGAGTSHETPEVHEIIRVEEIVNGICPKGKEYGYRASDWKEVQPPMDITELIKECELTTIEIWG